MFNYQLLAVITEVAQLGAPSCSRPHQQRTMASETVDPIDWSQPPPYTGQYPRATRIHSAMRAANHNLLHSVSSCTH